MIYVTYDLAGNLTGAYMQYLHPDHEQNHIEVTHEQHVQWYLYRANTARDGIELAPAVAPVVVPVVPHYVTMRQAELELLDAGLLDDIEDFMMTQPRQAQITWRRSSVVQRDNPLIAVVAAAKNMTSEQIDQLFIAAASR